jgi:hypothetical protein
MRELGVFKWQADPHWQHMAKLREGVLLTIELSRGW